MATVSCMLASYRLRVDVSDYLCSRRLDSCGISAFGGLATPREHLSRRSLAVRSVLSPSDAVRPTGRTRTAARGRKASARRTPQDRKTRLTDAAAAPARRRRRQTPTAAPEQHDVQQEHGDLLAGPAAPRLYQDCCGRVYSRSVYRIEVLDELMLDGLRVAELRGPAAFATVSNAVTIADVVAAAEAAAEGTNALDRAREGGGNGTEQACPRCTTYALAKNLAWDQTRWTHDENTAQLGAVLPALLSQHLASRHSFPQF